MNADFFKILSAFIRVYPRPILFLLLWILAACTEQEARPIAQTISHTAVPTPTLAAGLPTVPPPPPTQPPADTPALSGGEGAVAGITTEPLPTLTAVPTVTPLPTPTNLPSPVERVAQADANMHNGNFAQAITLLEANVRQADAFSRAEQIDNLYNLGVAYLREARYADALGAFEQLTSMAAEQMPTAVHFHVGQARDALGDYPGAITAYQAYLAANSDLGAYVYPLIAAAYTATGDAANAQLAREAAANAPAHRLTEIANRRALARLYLDAGNYAAAIAQYDAMRDLAITEVTKGEMTYLAGSAELLAGNTEAAYGRFRQALTAYPRAYDTYLGLVRLVEAGVPVDEYQRGLVNFHAKSYEPAIAAFTRYIEANPENYTPEAHLYAAQSYEALGNLPAALAELDSYANSNPAAAAFERGLMLARSGDLPGALSNYDFFLQNFPDAENAPAVAWRAALNAENQGNVATAVTRYTALADAYPWYERTPEALFHAGWLANQSGNTDTAVTLWTRAAQTYPANEYGSAALVWLLRTLPTYTSAHAEDGSGVPDPHKLLEQIQQQAEEGTAVNYYALRARDIAQGIEPFTAVGPFQLPTADEEIAAQDEAESWLRRWLGLEPGTDIRTLPPALANDARLIRGQKLWQLGLYEEGKRELEAMREAYAQDALSSYQLALFFRDLGLYRSSILAAARLPGLTGQSVFALPPFIGRLMYPVYYNDLVLPLAQQYSYDPRLQFALLRQESLFESFATSSAVAQGLSQVIPDTGAYIAQQLNWPNYRNEDLYKPYVGLNFGAFYLAQQLRAFDGTAHAALSAYNAGPGNAARWYAAAGSDLDLYIETVNFAETRLYIDRIYEGYVIYRFLYGGSN
ncbi:MAG TPA: transglycosylase SLT domain-containing protein [Chloroflexota bacterium]|nr:transglycosylase SLT domain-containing protein [Chloroflexota bacterium]